MQPCHIAFTVYRLIITEENGRVSMHFPISFHLKSENEIAINRRLSTLWKYSTCLVLLLYYTIVCTFITETSDCDKYI